MKRLSAYLLPIVATGAAIWQIADTCPKLIDAIPSRMHDEKRPGDVLKVPGDPLDDVADDAGGRDWKKPSPAQLSTLL